MAKQGNLSEKSKAIKDMLRSILHAWRDLAQGDIEIGFSWPVPIATPEDLETPVRPPIPVKQYHIVYNRHGSVIWITI